MTCKQLGGACDMTFSAETFEEIGELSKAHGMDMFQSGDEEHLQAMQEMMKLVQNPQAMEQWFAEKKAMFEALPKDE